MGALSATRKHPIEPPTRRSASRTATRPSRGRVGFLHSTIASAIIVWVVFCSGGAVSERSWIRPT
jgi:hypothetical protein